MNAFVSMCVTLGLLTVGCLADESGGGGGAGGEAPAHPCVGAQPWVEGSDGGTCDGAQVDVQCQHDGGVVECVEERWQPVECYVDTFFSCPEENVTISPCDEVWEGLSCGWFAADAGFSCDGTARCEGGSWISNGVDHEQCIGCEAD